MAAEPQPPGRAFLARWLARKQESRKAVAGAGEPTVAAAPPADEAALEAERAANRAAAEAVDLDLIGPDFDFSVFLRDGVPGALKTAALRRLWRSSPVFANLDGLNDYDKDFTLRSGGDVVKTAWEFGRGFLGGEQQEVAAAAVPPAPEESGPQQAAPEELVAEEAAPDTAAAAGSGPEQATPGVAAAPAGASPPDEGDRRETPRVALRQRVDLAAFRGDEPAD